MIDYMTSHGNICSPLYSYTYVHTFTHSTGEGEGQNLEDKAQHWVMYAPSHKEDSLV